MTPVASRGNGCLLIRFGKEKIQRPDAALDVGVCDHDIAAVDSHGAAGLPGQILEERGFEAIPRDAQMLELVRLD